MAVDNYALEVAILGHGGELWMREEASDEGSRGANEKTSIQSSDLFVQECDTKFQV